MAHRIARGLPLRCAYTSPTLRPASAMPRRAIHVTPVAHKRASKTTAGAVEDEDDFFGAPDEGDLFSSEGATASTSTAATEPLHVAPTSKKERAGKLTPEVRRLRYTALYEHVAGRIGRTPAVHDATSLVRNSAFTHLFDMAQTAEELERVTELFPQFVDGKRRLSEQEVENFVRRCAELDCPSLALRVFLDRPRYGLALGPLPLARRLLHLLALQDPVPLTDLVALSALFRAHGLPPIARDAPACAFMARACLRADTAHARAIAASLVPALRALLAELSPAQMKVPRHAGERQWFREALKDIRRRLKANGQETAWLDEWMLAAEYVRPSQVGRAPTPTPMVTDAMKDATA